MERVSSNILGLIGMGCSFTNKASGTKLIKLSGQPIAENLTALKRLVCSIGGGGGVSPKKPHLIAKEGISPEKLLTEIEGYEPIALSSNVDFFEKGEATPISFQPRHCDRERIECSKSFLEERGKKANFKRKARS